MDRSKRTSPASPSFADLLNHLFATRLSPKGRPYSLREVSEGTGGKLSIAYISLLRRGGTVGMPSADKVRALADFFGVDMQYFLGAHSAAREQGMIDAELEQALANPQVRDIALRASHMGAEQRRLLMQIMDHTEQLTRLAALPETGMQASTSQVDGDSGVEIGAGTDAPGG
jgi:transcriptional regulator with XRE-family HTH domain